MELSIQLFGIFKERIGEEKISISTPSSINSSELKALLEVKYDIVKEVQHYMLAVNQVYSGDESVALNENDEIALIPPVAGG